MARQGGTAPQVLSGGTPSLTLPHKGGGDDSSAAVFFLTYPLPLDGGGLGRGWGSKFAASHRTTRSTGIRDSASQPCSVTSTVWPLVMATPLALSKMMMWMKNTPLSLDMIFADETGKVLYVAADTVPFSEDIISAPVPVRSVLEVKAGTAGRIGVRPGDRIEATIFRKGGDRKSVV